MRPLHAAFALLLACASAPQPQPTPEPAPPAQPAPELQNKNTMPAPARPPPSAEETQPSEAPTTYRPLATPAPMQTVVLADAKDPIVSLRLVFHAGSVDDPKGKEGLTALTANLMAEATRSLSSAQLLDALFPMAAELSVDPSKEFTVFAGRVHKDFLDAYLPIFTDVLIAPRFDPADFDRLKASAIDQVRTGLREEDDETLGKVGLDSFLYPGHPYRHFVGGTLEGLQSITLDDVKQQAQRIFTQARLVVGLAGPIDDALQGKVKTALAQLPKDGAPLAALPPPPKVAGQVLILQKDTLSTAISAGFAYDLRRGDPDYFAVAFATSYLGEHRQSSGLLMNELRERRGLNYGDYAYAEHFAQAHGAVYPRPNIGRSEQDFTIWLRPVEPQNAVFATRAALYFLDDLLKNGLPKERFELIRSFLTGYTRLWEQTPQQRLGYAIDGVFYGTPSFLDAYRKAMTEMTPDSVVDAVRRHLDPKRLSFVYVTKDAQGLSQKLTSGAPSPIAYPTPKPKAVLAVDPAIASFPLPIDPAQVRIEPAQGFMQR
jgi:zinc protease